MGTNGKGRDGEARTFLLEMAEEGILPLGVNHAAVADLMRLFRRRSEQGMDTSQIRRFIEEGIAAYAEGNVLYAEVMLQIAHDSLC